MIDYTTFIIGSALSTIGMTILLIAGIILILKNKSLPAMIVFIGILLQVVTTVFHLAGNIVTGRLSAEAMAKFQGWMSIVQGFGYLVFCIGILLLIIDNFKRPAKF